MNTHAILAPAAVLVLWSLVVLIWMAFTRFKTLFKNEVDLSKIPVGSRYADLEAQMPAKVNWVSHNYTHLMEQPTLFYAVIAILALAGDSSEINVTLAWCYVALRIIHSLWQTLSNIVQVRIVLFTLSTLPLCGLAINAVILTLF